MNEEKRVITSSQRVERIPAEEVEYIPENGSDPTYRKQRAVYRTYNSVWFIVGIIETLLAFRFVFELLGANTANGFTQLVYSLSYPFAEPFRSIFGMTAVGVSIFDWSLIVAAVVYLLIDYGIIQLLRIIKPLNNDDLNRKINAV